MDLARLPNDKKLQLCRWYFKDNKHIETVMIGTQWENMGCLLLPFVWAVNAIWFFKEAFMKPPYDEQKQIKKYVLMSAVGAIAWVAVFAIWITVFQLQRVSWGATGDALSFIVPLGRA